MLFRSAASALMRLFVLMDSERLSTISRLISSSSISSMGGPALSPSIAVPLAEQAARGPIRSPDRRCAPGSRSAGSRRVSAPIGAAILPARAALLDTAHHRLGSRKRPKVRGVRPPVASPLNVSLHVVLDARGRLGPRASLRRAAAGTSKEEDGHQ